MKYYVQFTSVMYVWNSDMVNSEIYPEWVKLPDGKEKES